MKAVIVIDVDEKDIGREVNYISVKGGGMSYIIGAKDSQVLIRPLPKRKIVLEHRVGGYTVNGIEMTQAHGYNECLNEILGEPF